MGQQEIAVFVGKILQLGIDKVKNTPLLWKCVYDAALGFGVEKDPPAEIGNCDAVGAGGRKVKEAGGMKGIVNFKFIVYSPLIILAVTFISFDARRQK